MGKVSIEIADVVDLILQSAYEFESKTEHILAVLPESIAELIRTCRNKEINNDDLVKVLEDILPEEEGEISVQSILVKILSIRYLASLFKIPFCGWESQKEKVTLSVGSQTEPQLNVHRKKGISDTRMMNAIKEARGGIGGAAEILKVGYASVRYRVKKRGWEITRSPGGEVIVQKKT